MSVFIALARGINVGGKHKLAMKPLAALFEAAGARDVRTYIQSGNVIFTATGNSAARLVAQVSSAIAAEHGFAVPIVWRTASQWQALTLDPPFVPDQADASLVHVAFFAAQPVARFAASVLFPTPPFPLTTARMRDEDRRDGDLSPGSRRTGDRCPVVRSGRRHPR